MQVWREQHLLAGAVARLEDSHQKGATIAARARALRVPTPPTPAPGAPAADIAQALRESLATPGVVLATAGAEQVLGALVEASSRETVEHLFHAARDLGQSGLLEAMSGDAREELAKRLLEGVLHHGISFDAVHSVTHSVVDPLVHAAGDLGEAAHSIDFADVGGFNVPVLSILTFATREATLLLEEKKTWSEAATHMAVDTAGTTAGALGGGKAGALIGTMVAPGIGTAIGGAIGALVGTLVGRSVASSIKEAPLRGAMAAYQTAVDDAPRSMDASAMTMTSRIQAVSRREQAEYEVVLQQQPRVDDDANLTTLVHEVMSRVQTSFQREVKAANIRIDTVVLTLPPATAWSRLQGRHGGLRFQSRIQDARDEAARRFGPQLLEATSLVHSEPRAGLRALARLPLPEGARPALSDGATAIVAFDAAHEQALHRWAHRTSQAYAQATREVLAATESEATRHAQVIAEQRDAVARAAAEVSRHRSALGA